MKLDDFKAYAGLIPPVILVLLVALFLWLRKPGPEQDRGASSCSSVLAAGLEVLGATSEAQTNDALKRATAACRK